MDSCHESHSLEHGTLKQKYASSVIGVLYNILQHARENYNMLQMDIHSRISLLIRYGGFDPLYLL